MTTIQHVALNCRDITAQERFYTRHFGFRRSRVFNHGRQDEFVMIRLEGFCLELFTARAEGEPSAGEQEVGFKHLAFEVADIDVKVADLHAAGIETGPVHDCSDVIPGLRVCFLKDPEGNVLELMSGYADQADVPALE